jgi:hypothetical protein
MYLQVPKQRLVVSYLIVVSKNRSLLLALGPLRSYKRARWFSLTQAILFWASGAQARAQSVSLDLAISLVYLLNRLVSSPVEKGAEYDIRRLVTKGAMENYPQPDGDTIRRNRYGILFPHNVIGGSLEIDAPHFGPNLQLDTRTYEKLFAMTQQMTKMAILDKRRVDEGPPVPRQPGNRQRRAPTTYIVPYKVAINERDRVLLEPSHITFHVDLGVSAANHIAEVTTLSRAVTKIVARFYMDLVLCIPKRRTHPGYTKLSDVQRRQVTANTFQQLNLAICWNVICVRDDAPDSLWLANVKRLFPLSNDRQAKNEQTPCGYFTEWCRVIGSLEEASIHYLFTIVLEVSKRPTARLDGSRQ